MPGQLETIMQMNTEDSPADGSSLLQVATVLHRYRWFLITFIALGIIAGLAELRHDRALQTTGTLRFVSEGVTYGNRGFWDIVQKTRLNQLRALAVSESVPVSIRTTTDPWFLTVEVLHDQSGQGRQVLDRLTMRLPAYGGTEAESVNGIQSAGIRRELLSTWQVACGRAEQLLQKLTAGTGPEGQVAMDFPWEQTELPSISGPGTPLSLLPFSQWLQQLHVRTCRYFTTKAAAGAVILSEEEVLLQSSLDEAMMLMLRYRGALDLTAGYQPVVGTTLDAVTEVPRPIAGQACQNLLIGGWLGGLLGVLVCLPFDWLRVHWAIISGKEPRSSSDNESI